MKERTISVLFFTNTRARYGAEEHMLLLLKGLDRKLFRPYLVCPPELAEQFGSDLPDDIGVFPLRFDHPAKIREAARLATILFRQRIDILHSHMFQSSRFASPIGTLCGVPLVLETPHVAEKWRNGFLKSSFVYDRALGLFVDYFIAVSEANAGYLIGRKKLPRRKVVVVHNGTDLRKFNPDRQAPQGLKAALGFPEEDLMLLVPARLEPQKGHRVLLEALANVLGEFPRVRAVCLGEGNLRSELEQRAAALGLNANLRFPGFQPNIEDWFAASDLTVLPSLYEGLPLVAVESLAAGRPVVATAVDGTPEVVVHGITGLTVPPNDPRALAAAIRELLRNPRLRGNLASRGRRWVEEHFSQEKQIRATEELYRRALREKQGLPAGRVRSEPATASSESLGT